MFLETEKRPQGEPSREQQSPLADWAKALLKGAALIEERGWCQGDYQSEGRLCVLGAIKVAVGKEPDGDEDTDPIVFRAKKAMCASVGIGLIHEWNDDPARTKEEVVAKLRAVALGG